MLQTVWYCSVALLLYLSGSGASEDGQDESYIVGVVEFRQELLNMDIAVRTGIHLNAYKELLRSVEARPASIVVFPELTLNTLMDPVYVPDPKGRPLPCVESSLELLPQLSCLAKETSKYLVINLSEAFDCDSVPVEDPRPCNPNDSHRYNTNVVFDRNGTLIARYRKFNLFREPGTSVTHEPEIVTFETDFGVTFGVFTCFDLLFAKPTLELIKQGVKDFVFPAMWVSEPPFLTAVQIFESWAYANNVNLIASGTNYDPAGSTGTGVFNGRNGAMFSLMTGEVTRKLFPVRVPKIQGEFSPDPEPPNNSNTVSGRLLGTSLPAIKMGSDFLEKFTTVPINTTKSLDSITQTVCHGEFCCYFTTNFTTYPDRAVDHRYRYAVFDEVRTFQGYTDAHVSICGIITCLNETLTSCGLPLFATSKYLEFTEISISGTFNVNGTLVMPNTLDDGLHSLDADRFQFFLAVEYPNVQQQHAQLTLTGAVDNLQTFAIYAFNHKDFEFFQPAMPAGEGTTEGSGATEDDDDGGSSAVRSSALLIGILVVFCSLYRV